jgi:hypothetical protein
MPNEEISQTQEENGSDVNADTTEAQTDEGSEANGADVDKQQEPNEYKRQLDELKAQLAEKDEQLSKKDTAIENKNKAIKALKKGEPDDDELVEKVAARIEARQGAKQADSTIDKLSSDVNEAKLAKFHLENTIKRSGDPLKDAKAALALANADKFIEQRQYQMQEEGRENELASLSASTQGREPSKSAYKSPVTRQAEQFLDLINPKAKKFLQK